MDCFRTCSWSSTRMAVGRLGTYWLCREGVVWIFLGEVTLDEFQNAFTIEATQASVLVPLVSRPSFAPDFFSLQASGQKTCLQTVRNKLIVMGLSEDALLQLFTLLDTEPRMIVSCPSPGISAVGGSLFAAKQRSPCRSPVSSVCMAFHVFMARMVRAS